MNKTKVILLLFFISVNALVYTITQINVQQRIDLTTKNHLNKLQIHYDICIKNQKKAADTIYKDTIKNNEVISIIEQAWETKDPKSRNMLRGKMLEILGPEYEFLRKRGILQYQFVFPDNRVFLRLHKPDRYGDDLTDIRTDFRKTNNLHQITRGFFQGRTAHGLRNVYPIFNKKSEHIGAMEVSFPTELMQENLNEISKIYSHFLIHKNIFDVKQWNRNDIVLNYKQSIEHKDYLIAQKEKISQKLENKITPFKNVINENINRGKKFSLLSKNDNEYTILSFFPIINNLTGKTDAYIVSYEKDNLLATTIKDSDQIRLASFILSLFITLYIYYTIKQRNRYKSLVQAYDKNVNFSKVSLNGFITDTSNAFCNITGYSEEELIGKPYSFLRYMDILERSSFWEELKATRHLSQEMKNIKKDGTVYWVKEEFSPEYDDKGTLIGYSVIIQDITHAKDIEQVQKEIIFNMGSIGESRCKETGNHVKRVAEYSKLLALKYGLGEAEAEMLKQASPMHDIGKVAIPDSILNKEGPLDKLEWSIMQTHAQKGYDMLKVSDRPLLKAAAIVSLEHHEKWDGTGYPNGKKGEDIHIYGRITALADVFDALGSDRCYKKAWDDKKIFNLFKKERGKHFEPRLVDIFFENLEEFLKIRDKFKDLN